MSRTLAFALALCAAPVALAQDAPATPPAGAPPVAGAPSAPGAAPAPAPRAHKDVIKDATAVPGFFTLYRKDEKVWIEIKPDQLEAPFQFTWNIPSSLGERMLYASQMGGSQLVVWKKVGNHVQLIAKNHRYFAQPGTPQAQFVSEAFSDSLVASAPAASLPHPETKAVLVDAGALLFADIPGYLSRLEAGFRLPFTLDVRNTSFSRVNNTKGLTGLQVRAHFAVPRIPAPPLPNPAAPPVPRPPPPRAAPDPRSFFAGFYYSFAKLPETPMRARLADERIGHFVTTRYDYTEDTSPKAATRLVNRWRLEKKDPSAALSEPRQPITYGLDKNIPDKYRASVAAGVLEWNKAFERIGFKDAIVVKQQTDKDDFDTMDARHASIRWFAGVDLGFAIGPSHRDPRTGEILDADIATGYGFTRGARRIAVEDLGRSQAAPDALSMFIADPLNAHRHSPSELFPACGFTWQAAHEHDFAMDLLEARGLAWDGPEADQLAHANIKRNVMHEVGHTLGLRHNFRGSSIYTLQQVQDAEFTRKNGVVGSIMEYMPFNIALKGERQGEYINSTLGPYDYWAIEYAYREIPPAEEAAELGKIAARSTEPQLAYGTDEDAGFVDFLVGIDPAVNRFDLGDDPLEYYRKRMRLSRELWDRIQDLKLAPGESYERLTRSFASGMQQLASVAPLAAKYVGGVRHLRDRAGTGRALYEPTPAAQQRAALATITDGVLRVDSFRFKPEFVSRIGIDHFERPSNPDVSIAAAVLNVQRSVLDPLMSDAVAARLIDAQEKANGAAPMRLSEVYDTLQGAVWSELKTGQDITRMRRNLQREHLRRVATPLLRPSATTPADARALQRENAVALREQIRAAVGKPGLSREAKAHLGESLQALAEALKAPIPRSGV